MRVSDKVSYSDAEYGAAPDTTDTSWDTRHLRQGRPSATFEPRRGPGESPAELHQIRLAARNNSLRVQQTWEDEPTGLAAMPLQRLFLLGLGSGVVLSVLLILAGIIFS